jgi:Mg-chelatase subunit ChlI
VPAEGGSREGLRQFLNVADEDAWKLTIGFLVMMMRPTGPHPVLGVHGEQGAARSTAMRVLRKLVDPRETMDRSAPRNDHDLAIHAMHNRVVALDNLQPARVAQRCPRAARDRLRL